ncbi:hypothetical protein [Streptomyces sp. NPDC006640]|uniref:hypothetical protein n=1 Tax=unclassified Streptomyces TaxID=2593676 RepID=UPI0036939ECE
MSTTTEDAETEAAALMKCEACKTTVPRPDDCQFAPLWDAGWRWLGSLGLYSCPACPPVVVVDEMGAHKVGPGAFG